jgi:hypothetical protein
LRRADLLSTVAVVTLATAFLAPALRPGYTLLPLGLESEIAPWHEQVTQPVRNPLLSDPFYAFYPRRWFFTTSLRQGIYPLWNPYIFSGHPVMGDTAAQTFYPPNALAALFLSAARALPVLAWFHLVLTGISMFGFLRLLRLRPGPALFGAVAWMLNGNAVVWVENSHRLSTLAWLPILFLFYELAMRRARLWPGIVAGFLYGFSILGGHTQFALTNGIALGSYALLRAIGLSWQERRPTWRPLAIALLIGLVGVGIGALQLLPAYQLTTLSHRSVANVENFLRRGWRSQHIVGLWIPDFYGNPVRTPYWGDLNYAETTLYYGALGFPLALVAAVWTRRAAGRFFAAAQVVTLLIALGTPLARPLAWLPWVRYFRLISLIAYVPFFGAAAAAFGLDAAMDASLRDRARWIPLSLVLGGLIGLTALVALSQRANVSTHWNEISPSLWRAGLLWFAGVACLHLMRRSPKLAVSLLVVLLAADLLQWGLPFNPVNSLDVLYPENEVTALLRQDPSLFRVLPLHTDRVIFGPNVLSIFGFQEAGGYSSLMVERYRRLVKAIDDEVAIWWMRPNSNMLVNSRFDSLFSLLNVKYVLSTQPLDEHVVSVETVRRGCVGPGLQLTAGKRITGHFRTPHPGLNRVDVAFTSVEDEPADSVRFLLWREQEGGELIADVTVNGEDLPRQGMYPFFFAPVSDSAGGRFVWAIEAPQAGEEATVAVCQTEGSVRGHPAFTAYTTQLQLADVRQGVWIYENPNALPRAYVVHRAEIAGGQDALERLVASDLNPWTTAILEEPLAAAEAAALTDAPLRSSSAARIVRYRPHRVEVGVEMTDPGVLILSDAYYPGWKVTVDGQPAQLLRANYALRGVYLQTGNHQVVFRFAPRSLQLALLSTGISLVIGLVLLIGDLFHWKVLRQI